jgi:ankyrin repeat protein
MHWKTCNGLAIGLDPSHFYLIIWMFVVGCSNDGDRVTKIWDSVQQDDSMAVHEYVRSVGDLDTRKLLTRETLLQYAYESESRKTFTQLLEEGAPVDAKLSDGTCLIHRLVLDSDTWWLKQLLQAGADPNAWSDDGGSRRGTPLHFAIIENKVSAAELLIDGGAKIDCVSNAQGSNTLYEASFQYRWKIVALLIENGGQIDYGPPGRTFLDGLKKRGYGMFDTTFRMEGFDEVLVLLERQGVGEEAFGDCLWGKKKYSDYLKEGKSKVRVR